MIIDKVFKKLLQLTVFGRRQRLKQALTAFSTSGAGSASKLARSEPTEGCRAAERAAAVGGHGRVGKGPGVSHDDIEHCLERGSFALRDSAGAAVF